MIKNKTPLALFFVFFLANLFFWSYAKNIQSFWANVPPVPSVERASMLTLGDRQLAYRTYASMLQNLGNVGGRYLSLVDYDYERLKDWFFLEDHLDPVADVVPMMAAYYFGGVKDKEKQKYVIDYLEHSGQSAIGEKWRWLGHAVYLARHEQEDNDRALELAYKLADNKSPDLADWAKQMPAFVLQEKGDDKMAYQIMLNILISNIDKMHPNEINFMVEYLCVTLPKNNPSLYNPQLCKKGGP